MTNIGIIGVGTIASALVRGFCTAPESSDLHFNLSPRGAAKAAALAESFPEQVTVCSSNQEVLDRSEWVFLTVLPRQGEEVLTPLTFRPDHKIMSIMSDNSLEKVTGWTGPVAKIFRMVPLPFAAMHIGPIAYYPQDEEVQNMFAPLGQIIAMGKESELSVISALTAVMSAYYQLICDISKWGAAQGLAEDVSLSYMSAFFEALSIKSRTAENGDIQALALEMTPGGLNDMAWKFLTAEDSFQDWCRALDQVMDRLNHK